ncbi:MAG: TRAP transporter large permease [Oscillospiraceae bacterium]|nr:TRAP transporter large permease [Oscillospiraceae bacterium]
MVGLMIFGTLLVAMLLGFPVCFAILMACFAYLLSAHVPLTIVPQTMVAGMNSFVLLAIPLFTMTGYLMEQTSLSQRLVDFVESLFARSRGSMGVVTIVTCAIFAALTGSGPATVAAIGAIMMPALTKAGYPRETSAGMIAAGGALGPIIPPSANMVVYGATMGLSVSKMFIGGVGPGILMTVCLCLVNVGIAAKRSFAKSDARFPAKVVLRRTLRAIPTLLLPVIILGGIYGGLVTPTEAAVLSVIYATAYGLITRELRIKALFTAMRKTVLTSAVVTFIIAAAKVFGWILSKTRLPAILGAAIMAVIPNKWVYLAVLMLILFIVGCLMDTIPSILILAPILVPVGIDFGLDPLHLGVLFCITLTVGFITPPFGINLFTAVSTTGVPYGQVVKGVIPFMIIMLVCALICAFIPQIITFLPGLMLGA